MHFSPIRLRSLAATGGLQQRHRVAALPLELLAPLLIGNARYCNNSVPTVEQLIAEPHNGVLEAVLRDVRRELV
jgi:hypothetical protein